MDERDRMGIIESILFVSGESVSLKEISKILNMDIRLTRKFMERMIDCFNFERRGIQIIKANDTYQLATRPEYCKYIDEYIGPKREQSLSQAALETLTIVAYRQPVTRMDIESIRGVKCDHSLVTLINKGFIKETGRLDAPGRPILYGTTDLFLRSFGLSSIEDLPELDKEEDNS